MLAPVQVSTNALFAKSVALVSTPLVPLLPDQAPEATHCAAFALDQEIVTAVPYATAEALVEMLIAAGGVCVVTDGAVSD